ncbi:MAG: hypothetical protein PHW10_04865 [Candidatus Peribacteraceae bacterium]|nr:hypothetical protein [Candidatus Peribacteraceae bacterium]
MPLPEDCDAFILDTCKIVGTGTYRPGAITFAGRRKRETMQWKDCEFRTQGEADAFVRRHFERRGIREAENEGVLRKAER